MRIGINPITWSNDDLPELGATIPLDQCLAEAAAAGYEGIELGGKFPRDAAVLGPLLEQHGLALVSGWYGARLLERPAEAEFAFLEPHQELLEALGAKVTIVAEVSHAVHGDRCQPLSARPVLDTKTKTMFYDRLAVLGAHLTARGSKLVYHHHMGTCVQGASETEELLRETPPDVGLVFDSGHFFFAGGDARSFLERWAGRIGHVHLKDVRAEVLARYRGGCSSFLDAVVDGVFTVPGDGVVDFGQVLGPLVDSGYDGWLVVEAEQDPAVANPFTYAKLGRLNVERFLREARAR